MAYTGSMKMTVDLKDYDSSVVATNELKFAWELVQAYVDGVGANQVNAMWGDVRPLTDGGNESLDLAPTPAVVTSVFAPVTFARIKVVFVWCPSTNTTTITFSRPAANGVPLFGAASGALAALPPGGGVLISIPSAAGVAVTGGTGDLLTFTNSPGAAATYGVFFAGSLT